MITGSWTQIRWRAPKYPPSMELVINFRWLDECLEVDVSAWISDGKPRTDRSVILPRDTYIGRAVSIAFHMLRRLPRYGEIEQEWGVQALKGLAEQLTKRLLDVSVTDDGRLVKGKQP